MRQARRAVTAFAALAAAAAVIFTAGCASTGQPVTYAPAAYGVPGHCYYVDSPAEALALRAAGLCPAAWTPTPMPLTWEEEYWDYCDSPAYYGTYVPVSARTVYIHRETAFGRTYRTAIAARSRTATYRSSSGTLVKGTHLTGKTRFGSGTSFGSAGQKYGSGSLRSRSGTAGGSVTSRGTTSGSRSGGFSGGSLRSGGRSR
jgi:hypothetical protein